VPRRSAKILDGLEVNLRFLKEIGVEDLDMSRKKKAVKPAPYVPQGGTDGTAKPGGVDPLSELHDAVRACRP
jgi:hypothetical protein